MDNLIQLDLAEKNLII
jgi:hypothetical protein